MASAAAPVTIPALAAFAWLLTPFLSGSLVACSYRLRTATAHHLRLCLTVGWIEGFEINFLGAVLGFDIRRPALKFPGIGRLGMTAGI